MIHIEQVRLLESRVTKAIDYVNKLTDENTLLKNKLDGYEKKIKELEVLIERFKEDQVRIEEGIVSALNHLNRFEDDVEKTLSGNAEPPRTEPAPKPAPVPEPEKEAVPPLDPAGDAGDADGEAGLAAAYTVDEADEEPGAAAPPLRENQAAPKEAAPPPAAALGADGKELEIF